MLSKQQDLIAEQTALLERQRQDQQQLEKLTETVSEQRAEIDTLKRELAEVKATPTRGRQQLLEASAHRAQRRAK